MNKSPKKSRYLSPKPFGEIINHRFINYSKESESKIILCLKQGNLSHEFSTEELRSALKETEVCVSRLAALFLPEAASKKEIEKLANQLFIKLGLSLTDEQKKKLRNLIRELLFQDKAFGKEINTRTKEAAKKAIKIACKIEKSPSIEKIKSKLLLTNKISAIEVFFSENIVGPYEDPLTIKRTKSSERFKKLYEAVELLEKELQFFLQYPLHTDTIYLKKEFQQFPRSMPSEYSDLPEIPHEIKGYKKRREIKDLLRRSFANKSPNSNSNITLQAVANLIYCLKLVCSKLINEPGRLGRKNPAFFETVNKLADVWKKYTGREPTRINYSDYGKGSTHSPFLTYIEESIKSIIPIDANLLNIAKEVISFRKHIRKSMAKTSSK